MTHQGIGHKPVRLGRKARRALYKTVHIVLPQKVREPLRNAIKGPAPSAEELGARRQADQAERRAQKEARDRAKAAHAAEKERKATAKAMERSAARADRQAQKEAVQGKGVSGAEETAAKDEKQREAAKADTLIEQPGPDNQAGPG